MEKKRTAVINMWKLERGQTGGNLSDRLEKRGNGPVVTKAKALVCAGHLQKPCRSEKHLSLGTDVK